MWNLILTMYKLLKKIPKVWYISKIYCTFASLKVSIYIINNLIVYELWHMYVVTTASLAVHVRASAQLRQFLRVRSILSTLISAQSVVLVQVFVLLRLSAFPNI